MQEGGRVGSHFGTSCKGKKSPFDSESHIAAASVPLRVKAGPMTSSLVSLDTSMAGLEQASRQYFRIYERRSFELVSNSNEPRQTRPILYGTVELLLTDSVYSVCRKQEPKDYACTKSSIPDTDDTIGLLADMLRSYGHAIFIRSAR